MLPGVRCVLCVCVCCDVMCVRIMNGMRYVCCVAFVLCVVCIFDVCGVL